MRPTDESVQGSIAGVPISIKGLNMMIFLAFAGIAALSIWVLGMEVTKRQDTLRDRITQEHNAISTAIEKQTTALEKQTEALVEQNYILLADDKETQDLRKVFRRPESLRRKLGQ